MNIKNYLHKHQNLIIIFLLFCFNLSLRFIGAEYSDISHDEPFSIFHAQNDVVNIIANLKFYNNPPLYEVLLHFWIKLFGISTLSVRTLSIFLMSFTSVLIFMTGLKYINLKVGLTAALLFSFSSISYYYSHDARAYALFLFLSISSSYLFFKQLTLNNALLLFIHAIINVLLIYTHYFGFIIIGVQIGILFFNNSSKKLLISYLVSFVLYLPQFAILFQRFLESAKHGTWLNEPVGIESIYNMLWSYTNAPVSAVFSICLIIFFIIRFKKIIDLPNLNIQFLIYAFTLFLLAFIGMFLLSYKVPMYLDRYLIFALPFLYYILAISTESLFKNKILIHISLLILILLFMFSVTIKSDKRRDVKGVVNYVNIQKNPETLLIVCPKDFAPTFAYHYNIEYFKNAKGLYPLDLLCQKFNNEEIVFVNHYSEVNSLEINKYTKLIYLDAEADFAMPKNGIYKYLLGQNTLMTEHRFNQSFILSVFKPK